MPYDTTEPTPLTPTSDPGEYTPDDPVSTAVLEDAQRAVREGTPVLDEELVRDAVRASERMDGAAVTEARIRDGSLVGGDGQPILTGASESARADAAAQYVSGLREQAGAAGGPLGKTESQFVDQYDLMRGHLGTHYADPESALERLRDLDDEGVSRLVSGDTRVLGEPSPEAPTDGPNVDALLAHRDVTALYPEAADRAEAARDHERARELVRDFDDARGERQDPDAANVGQERGGDLEVPGGNPGVPGGPDPVAEPTGGKATDPAEMLNQRVMAYSLSPHQI